MTVGRLAFVGLIALSLPGGSCSKPSSSEGPFRMATEPQFNRVARQLIDPPAPSEAMLEQGPRDRTPPVAGSADDALVQARSWVQEALREEYWPTAQTAFIAIPLEAGVCDVVRARYQVGATRIDVAQSRYVLSIRVANAEAPQGVSGASIVERVAVRMLALPSIRGVETSGMTERRTAGRILVPVEADADPDWPDWRQSLQWWASGGEIGFIATKLPGGPTREDISDDEESNVRWFQ